MVEVRNLGRDEAPSGDASELLGSMLTGAVVALVMALVMIAAPFGFVWSLIKLFRKKK